jgi:preprotein translocase subunit SecA
MLYDTCELIKDNKRTNDFKTLDLIRYFSITSPVAEADFLRLTEIELTGKYIKKL